MARLGDGDRMEEGGVGSVDGCRSSKGVFSFDGGGVGRGTAEVMGKEDV